MKETPKTSLNRDLTLEALVKPYKNWDFFSCPRPTISQTLELLSCHKNGRSFHPNLAWLFSEVSALSYTRDHKLIEDSWKKLEFEVPIFFDDEGSQGHVAISDTCTVLAYRGTEVDDMEDIRADLNVKLVGSTGGLGRVHNGFSQALINSWSSIIPTLRNRDHLPLWITGHSLGGALAILSGETLENIGATYTYGAPKIGCETYAKNYPNQVYRITNNNDIVPLLPPLSIYSHVGEEHFIDFKGELVHKPKLVRSTRSKIIGNIEDIHSIINLLVKDKKMAILDSRVTDHSLVNYMNPLKMLLEATKQQ